MYFISTRCTACLSPDQPQRILGTNLSPLAGVAGPQASSGLELVLFPKDALCQLPHCLWNLSQAPTVLGSHSPLRSHILRPVGGSEGVTSRFIPGQEERTPRFSCLFGMWDCPTHICFASMCVVRPSHQVLQASGPRPRPDPRLGQGGRPGQLL